jgi:hypothetical protein
MKTDIYFSSGSLRVPDVGGGMLGMLLLLIGRMQE